MGLGISLPSFSDIGHAVRNGVSGTLAGARDFGSAALQKGEQLAQDGADLGRRAVDAVRSVDVRQAASVVREKIGEGTEAARAGIKTGVEWTGQKVHQGAEFARDHVPGGDNLVSNGIRNAITTQEDVTRFGLGVVGGVSREAVGLAGTVGQLGTTAAEMQLSPAARAEYGQKILDGAKGMATATGSYIESAAQDPSRIGTDLSNAAKAGEHWVGGQIDRYGQAFQDGKGFETVGMDVGTVATYLVPVGGGPVRGALTAAARDGAELAVRAGGEASARVVTGAAEARGAALVERLAAHGGTAPLEKGAGRVADLAAASKASGRELAVYRDGTSGQRMVTIGEAGQVSVPADSRLIAHTQAGSGAASLQPSAADIAALETLGQRSSAIIDQSGTVSRFGTGDAAGVPAAPIEQRVILQAPRDVTFADGGSIHYGALDELGRPTGITAHITPDMIGAGTPANSSIHPPGWSGNGIANNEARGHLLGRQLGGSGDLPENLVTLQQRPANSPVMSGFEGQVRKAVEGGQAVDYTSTPVYAGDELVPRGITLTGSGSKGFDLGVTILNPIAK
jgi:hypothetical protein